MRVCPRWFNDYGSIPANVVVRPLLRDLKILKALFCCKPSAFKTSLSLFQLHVGEVIVSRFTVSSAVENTQAQDHPLFILNHPFDYNVCETGILSIFKSFYVHFCRPQIYIPMKIPKTAQLKRHFVNIPCACQTNDGKNCLFYVKYIQI